MCNAHNMHTVCLLLQVYNAQEIKSFQDEVKNLKLLTGNTSYDQRPVTRRTK